MTTPPLSRHERAQQRRERRRERRAERGDRRRVIALLPQALTTGNLGAGFYSITLSASGDLDRAALAILFAVLFDIADGRVARLAKAESRFGAEYDSIADTVSFGVAPGILAFSAGALQELGWTGWVLAFLFTACAALRLARFNVMPAKFHGRFEGLASPAAAGMVLSSVWFAGFMREGLEVPFEVPAALAGIGVAALALLMVSPVPYRSFKDVRLSGGYGTVVVMVLVLALIFAKPAVTLFVLGLAYVSSGPLEWLWRWRTGATLDAIAIANDGPDDPAHAPGTSETEPSEELQ